MPSPKIAHMYIDTHGMKFVTMSKAEMHWIGCPPKAVRHVLDWMP